jgi:hypothetical protein
MDRQFGALQIPLNNLLQFGPRMRQRMIWQHKMAMGIEIPTDLLTLGGKIGSGLSQVHGRTGVLSRGSRAKLIEQLFDVLGQVVKFGPEFLFAVPSEHAIELAHALGFRLLFVEGVTK